MEFTKIMINPFFFIKLKFYLRLMKLQVERENKEEDSEKFCEQWIKSRKKKIQLKNGNIEGKFEEKINGDVIQWRNIFVI